MLRDKVVDDNPRSLSSTSSYIRCPNPTPSHPYGPWVYCVVLRGGSGRRKNPGVTSPPRAWRTCLAAIRLLPLPCPFAGLGRLMGDGAAEELVDR